MADKTTTPTAQLIARIEALHKEQTNKLIETLEAKIKAMLNVQTAELQVPISQVNLKLGTIETLVSTPKARSTVKTSEGEAGAASGATTARVIMPTRLVWFGRQWNESEEFRTKYAVCDEGVENDPMVTTAKDKSKDKKRMDVRFGKLANNKELFALFDEDYRAAKAALAAPVKQLEADM